MRQFKKLNDIDPRRQFIKTLSAVALMAPFGTYAQGAASIHRVGWLGTGAEANTLEFANDVQTVLRELGYRDRKTVSMEVRAAEFQPDRLPRLAAELVALNPSVIVGGGTAGTRAASRATSTIPILMVSVSDPVGDGFVASLARPGRNITGTVSFTLDTVGKTMELLKVVAPYASRVAVLRTGNPSHATIAQEYVKAGAALGLSVITVTATSAEDLDKAFAAMAAEKANGLVVISDSLTYSNAKRIADLAASAKIPALYGNTYQVEAGGLMSYGPSTRNQQKEVAWYIDKLLQGVKPADLPVQQPTEFEMAVNVKTAKALGIVFPREILLRTDVKVE